MDRRPRQSVIWPACIVGSIALGACAAAYGINDNNLQIMKQRLGVNVQETMAPDEGFEPPTARIWSPSL